MQTNDECAVKQQSRMKLDWEKQIETTFYTLIQKKPYRSEGQMKKWAIKKLSVFIT